MASSTFGDFFQNVDSTIQSVFGSAASGMSAYILPVGWMMFAISLLVWAYLVMNGKVDSPMSDWIMKGLVIILILSAAGTYYNQWISGPLFQLPSDLSAAIGLGGTPSQVLDTLDDKVESLIGGIASSMVDNFQNLNFGGGIVMLVALVLVTVACVLLIAAAAYNILYAKFGLAILLAFGPFFVIWLIWKQTQQWFWSWLNTVLYFVFLSVAASLFVIMFIKIADNYMTKLSEVVTALAPAPASASLGEKIAGLLKNAILPPSPTDLQATLSVLRVAFQFVFICVPLFFIEINLPTIVASMTGGSGSSVTSGVNIGLSMMKMAAGGKGGGGKGGKDGK